MLAVIAAACFDPSRTPPRLVKDPDSFDDGRLRPPPGPSYPEQPGREWLRRWVEACRDAGIAHHPEVFRKAGTVVIQWAADRGGDLLQLEFRTDTYRGWEVRPQQTFADCVVSRARAGKLRWSREGTAPLRLNAATSQAARPRVGVPASGPTSRPGGAKEP